jgi:PhzF family phenazine biosynthesis protein
LLINIPTITFASLEHNSPLTTHAMTYIIYQIDAFTDQLFGGNPAAVVPLEEWIDEQLMQKIANENNLSETAFYVKKNKRFEIRWFTPEAEVDLCGHATLGAAFIIFNCTDFEGKEIPFYSHRSGDLIVNKNGDWLDMTFPADDFKEVEITPEIEGCFDKKPSAIFKGKTDYLFIYENESDIQNIQPHLDKIAKFGRGIIVSAKGDSVDFVSRFFAPQVGVNEDPVTGSAHTTLIPYWSHQLGKNELVAQQLSKRKGFLKCKNLNGKVVISGQGKLYMKGEIYV